MARKEHEQGKEGEKLARQVLRSRGVRMVEKIGTPVRLVPIPGVRNGFKCYFGDKVSGDMVGLLDDGTRVIAETKSIKGKSLQWSKLRKHQPERLSLNKIYNGVSLLVWVSDFGVYVLDWIYPNDDFKPGKGLTAVRAAELNVMDVRKLAKVKK